MGTHPIFESDFDCLTEAMKRPGLKAGSKRQNIRLREKIKKKVAEHKRKERRDAKKSPGQGKTKKQHVPNSAPFKDEVMSEAIAHARFFWRSWPRNGAWCVREEFLTWRRRHDRFYKTANAAKYASLQRRRRSRRTRFPSSSTSLW